MAGNEEHACRRVTQAVGLVRTLLADYGGRVQHVAGDSILALFESAEQSLQFAIAIQRELRTDALWQGEDQPIPIPSSD
jgi:adenylate cyclase